MTVLPITVTGPGIPNAAIAGTATPLGQQAQDMLSKINNYKSKTSKTL